MYPRIEVSHRKLYRIPDPIFTFLCFLGSRNFWGGFPLPSTSMVFLLSTILDSNPPPLRPGDVHLACNFVDFKLFAEIKHLIFRVGNVSKTIIVTFPWALFAEISRKLIKFPAMNLISNSQSAVVMSRARKNEAQGWWRWIGLTMM